MEPKYPTLYIKRLLKSKSQLLLNIRLLLFGTQNIGLSATSTTVYLVSQHTIHLIKNNNHFVHKILNSTSNKFTCLDIKYWENGQAIFIYSRAWINCCVKRCFHFYIWFNKFFNSETSILPNFSQYILKKTGKKVKWSTRLVACAILFIAAITFLDENKFDKEHQTIKTISV